MSKKFIFAPVENPQSCFIIKFKYSHGDADLDTYGEFKIEECDSDILEDYLEHFKKVAQAINDNRSYNTPYPEGLIVDSASKLKNWNNVYVPLQFDEIYSGSSDYASVEIEDVYFYNEEGLKHVLEDKYSHI